MRRWSYAASCLSVALALAFGSTASAAGGARKDPFLAFCFKVTVSAQGEAPTEGFFKSVGGLKSEAEVVDYREGGAAEGTRKLIGAVKWKNIVLKRAFAGLSANDPFQKWARQVFAGEDVRKDVLITLLDQDQNEVLRLQFARCVVVGWDFGAYLSPRDSASSPRDLPFDAVAGELGVETIEIAHEGMKIP